MTQPPTYGGPAYQQAPPPGFPQAPHPGYQNVPPPGYQPEPPTKPRKPILKRWWFWVAVVVVLGIIISATGGSKSGSSTTAAAPSAGTPAAGATPAAPSAEKKAPGIGSAVRDGKFEFTVTSAPDCSTKQVGGQYGQKAQGVFCIVPLHVTNIGNEAQTFSDTGQTAFDGQGRKYSTDTAAGIYLDGSHSFFEQLNPGSSVDGKIVFDVPVGTQLTSIELHDSMFSGGIKVALG